MAVASTQPLLPTLFFARTCTLYSTRLSRLPMVMLMSRPVCPASVQWASVAVSHVPEVSQYRTS